MDSPSSSAVSTLSPVELAGKRAWFEGNLRRINEGRRRVAAMPMTLQEARALWLGWTRDNPDPILAYDAAMLHHIFAEQAEADPGPPGLRVGSPPPPSDAPAQIAPAEASQSSVFCLCTPPQGPLSADASPPTHSPPPPPTAQPAHSTQDGAAPFLAQPDGAELADDSLQEVTPPSPTAADLRLRSRRIRRPFQPEEDAAILQGVRVFGPHSWNRIVAVYGHKLRRRTNIQIKDRYRVLQRQGKA